MERERERERESPNLSDLLKGHVQIQRLGSESGMGPLNSNVNTMGE
jgi:hypothetical protein